MLGGGRRFGARLQDVTALEVSPRSHSNGGGSRGRREPSHAPIRPLPSANPGTMPARAIQAFQPNPAIEIQGFNLNAIPWAAGEKEGKREGRGMLQPHSPFLTPSHWAPALPPNAPDHRML